MTKHYYYNRTESQTTIYKLITLPHWILTETPYFSDSPCKVSPGLTLCSICLSLMVDNEEDTRLPYDRVRWPRRRPCVPGRDCVWSADMARAPGIRLWENNNELTTLTLADNLALVDALQKDWVKTKSKQNNPWFIEFAPNKLVSRLCTK